MISPMQLLRVLATFGTFALAGCAASTPEVAPAPVGPAPEPILSPAAATPALPPAPSCDMFLKPGVVKRTALVRVINAGMARWLQGVDGDRALGNHRFQGWVIKRLHPADPCYREVDLRSGDVVQRVNGKSIEKPDQAFEVFESLRTAPAVAVEYLRDGKPRQVTLPISDEP
jgi:S1-C subfamily serine protease